MNEDYAELIRMHDQTAVEAKRVANGDRAVLHYGERSAAAARAIRQLIAEREALREALKPFAREANEWPNDIKDDWRICKSKATPITVGDLRRARAALKQGTT